MLFSKKIEVGDYWDRADIKLNSILNPFQLIIEAVSGEGFLGYLAIDDTSFTSGCISDSTPLPIVTPIPTTTKPPKCGYDNFECRSNGKCIPLKNVCDFVKQCADGSDEADCGKKSFLF